MPSLLIGAIYRIALLVVIVAILCHIPAESRGMAWVACMLCISYPGSND